MTAPTSDRPVCDQATLAEPCTSCGRAMHRTRNARTCRDGHPSHHGHSVCAACASRVRRARAARPAQPRPARRPASQAHTYCVHDEGERCDCDVELRRHMPEKERKQGRKADR